MVALLVLSLPVAANIDFIKNNRLQDKNVEAVKIVYTGPIEENEIKDFLASLDEANNNYPNAKHIYLYINSYGGQIDAGYMAYQAIRSSRIPVTAINAANVISAASVMFCGATKRAAVPHAAFLLHPSSRILEGQYRPDELKREAEYLDQGNAILKLVYRTCTSLSDEELTDILHSEANSAFISVPEATTKGIITDTLDLQPDTQVSFYVTRNACVQND